MGSLKPGDLAVWIGVSAIHRAPAFEACSFFIDQLKARVPIWKKETYTDGATEWTGSGDNASALDVASAAP